MSNRAGFTLIEIVLVTAIIAVISAIAVPNILHAREKSHASVCFANREALMRAEQVFQSTKNRHSLSIDELANADIYLSAHCPKGGVYFWADFDESSDLFQSLMGCSIHAVATTPEENEVIFAKLLMSDDFSGDLSNWGTMSGSWRVENGTLVANTGKTGMVLSKEADFTNGTMSVDVKFDNPNSAAAILFRANAKGTTLANGYSLEIDKKRNAFIYTEINGGKSIELDKAPIPKGFDWNATHNLEVKAENDRFTLYVDGREVLTSSDSKFTSGSVGLYADKQVTFDNFQMKDTK